MTVLFCTENGAGESSKISAIGRKLTRVSIRRFPVLNIPWDQPATLIDLDGKPPSISTVRDCVRHFAILTHEAQQKARMLLTRPTFRADRKSRTWLLNPDEIALLLAQMRAEKSTLN